MLQGYAFCISKGIGIPVVRAPQPGFFRRGERALLYAAVVASAVLLLALVRRYDALRDQHKVLTERIQWPHPGYSVPTFETATIDGDSVTVGRADHGRQFLIFFTTECPYCRASVDAWNRITAAAQREIPDVASLGIALDPDGPLDAYRREHHLVFPIVKFPDEKLRRLYRARSVPLVVLLDSTGRVLYSRLGALENEVAIDSVLYALNASDPVRTDLSADVAARDP